MRFQGTNVLVGEGLVTVLAILWPPPGWEMWFRDGVGDHVRTAGERDREGEGASRHVAVCVPLR